MSMQSKQNRIVVVLGMHRSGTSAIARALQALYVDLGEKLIAGIPDNNEKGFYEDVDVNRLDSELMAALDRRWDSLAPIDRGDLQGDIVAVFRRRAIDLLRERVKDRPFGLKDPRISKLLPFWKSVFGQAGLEPCYVIAVRHPLSIVHSLRNRDGFDAEKGYWLWLEHILPMLSETAGAKRVVVDFDGLLAAPATELQRIAHALDLPFIEKSPAVREYIEEFLDDSLRHTRYELEDLRRDPAASADVIATYELMSRLARDQTALEAPEVTGQLEELNKRLLMFAPAFTYMDRWDGRIAALNQAVTERDGQVADLNQAVAERDGHIASLNEHIASLNQHIASLNQHIAGLLASNSWRLTRPFRFLRRALSAIFRKISKP